MQHFVLPVLALKEVLRRQSSDIRSHAHLDHNAGNNTPDNLARLCPTHHWMYDAGLYPVEAIRSLQAHWQATLGRPDHKGRMKDAGAKAALTRKRKAACGATIRMRVARQSR